MGMGAPEGGVSGAGPALAGGMGVGNQETARTRDFARLPLLSLRHSAPICQASCVRRKAYNHNAWLI